MKAMVFAAGFGTRLKSITQSLPKCLVEVAGKTMLEHVVDRLKLAGVTELVINLHYLGDQIRSFVNAKGDFGLKVHFSVEPEILGTGGGLLHAIEHFRAEECFIVHNSDVYSNIDLQDLIETQRKSHAVATLAVMSRPSPRVLLFDDRGELLGYENKKEGNRDVVRECASEVPLAFSGIQVCSPKIFDYMRSEKPQFSTIWAYMNAARQGASIQAYRMDGDYWIDMGTPERLEELRKHLQG